MRARDRPIHPAFRRMYLKRLARHYNGSLSWAPLVEFVDQPLFATALPQKMLVRFSWRSRYRE